MAARYAKLGKDWLMRGWSDVPFAVVNWTRGDVRPLDPQLAHAARACDGETDFNSLLFLPVHISVLDKLIEHGVADECEAGDKIAEHQRFRKAKSPFLLGIHWALTGRCNLRCRHCSMEAPDQRYADVSDPDVQKILEQFERANVFQVIISGGEPFLRRDLLDVFARLGEKHVRVRQIFSNGLLITDAHLVAIRDLCHSPQFSISFDGCGLHDRMRGTTGTERKVLDAISRVRSHGFGVNVATSIDKSCRHGLVETYERLKALDIQSWQVAPPNRTGNWRGVTTQLLPADEASIYAPVLRRWCDDGKPFALQLGTFFNSRTDQVGDDQPSTRIRHTPDSFDCGVCRLTPQLLPDGTLIPCHGFAGTGLVARMPNLRHRELAEVWSSSTLSEIVGRKKKDVLEWNPECAGCEQFERCGMGCRARAYVETGELSARDPVACEVFRQGHKERLLEGVAPDDVGGPARGTSVSDEVHPTA